MFPIVSLQQEHIVKGICPKANDDIILNFPKNENHDEFVDIKTQKHPNIRMLPVCRSMPFSSPNTEAGFECSSFVRKGLWNRLDALAKNLNLMRSNTDVVIFEGFRNKEACELVKRNAHEIMSNLNPELDSKLLDFLVENFLATSHAHSTGGSVSLLLYDSITHEPIDLGQFGNAWGPNPQSLTFASNLSDEQKKNRTLLLSAASMSGLVNYPYEWWNFSFGDSYFAFYTSNKSAIYSPVI